MLSNKNLNIELKERNNSFLLEGNKSLRKKNYDKAISLYINALVQNPTLSKAITDNIVMAKNKFSQSRKNIEKKKVAVCSCNLEKKSVNRVYTLAKIYETFSDIEIVSCLFPGYEKKIWKPIRNTTISIHTFIVEDESKFLQLAIRLVADHPYDIVHLSKPRIPNIFFGILYKLIWNAQIIVDIDDEELAFVGIDIDEFINIKGSLPKLKNLEGIDWTRLAVGLVNEFDGITVSNLVLQKHYGGEIVRHARDEKLYQPSAKLTYKSRKKFGIAFDRNVVLFFGTPREHKCLLETADAIATLQYDNVLFVIVGDFPDQDQKLKERLLAKKDIDYQFIGNQSFEDVPKVVAAGNICIFLQDENSEMSKFQVPANLSDALGMGLPVIVNDLPIYSDLKANSLFKTSLDGLQKTLQSILEQSNVDIVTELNHEIFLKEFSFKANFLRLNQVLNQDITTDLSLPLSILTNVDQMLSTLIPSKQLKSNYVNEQEDIINLDEHKANAFKQKKPWEILLKLGEDKKNIWIGGICPISADIFLYNKHQNYRASPEQHQNYSVVWLYEQEIFSIPSWKLLIDESIRFIKHRGILIIRSKDSEKGTLWELKSMLGRMFNNIFRLERQFNLDDSSTVCVFNITRKNIFSYHEKNWTIGILSDGKKNKNVLNLIEKISRLKRKRKVEIIIAGLPIVRNKKGIINVSFLNEDNLPRISEKKKIIVEQASYENIAIFHDRYLIDDNFFKGFDSYGYDFDFLTIKQFYETGEEFPGYAGLKEKKMIWQRPAYDSTYNTCLDGQFINGGLMILKKTVGEAINFNGLLLHNEAEDVELSFKLQESGIMPRINKYSSATTIDTPIAHTSTFEKLNEND